MATLAVVQGSSRGIGRAFAQHLLSNTKLNVVGTSRDPSAAKEAILDGLDAKHHDRLTTVALDGKDEGSIKDAAARVTDQFGQHSLRFLINCSGVLHVEKGLGAIDADKMLETFQLNTFAHLLTFKHFAPLLPSAKSKANELDHDPAHGVIPSNLSVLASLTARVGSIGDNGRGGWYSYRASKAAANQIIKTLSHELKMKSANNALAIALHPGTVTTQLSAQIVDPSKAGSKPGVHDPEQAVKLMFETIAKLKLEDTGRFLAYDGSEIEW